jgi:hypothetical protein
LSKEEKGECSCYRFFIIHNLDILFLINFEDVIDVLEEMEFPHFQETLRLCLNGFTTLFSLSITTIHIPSDFQEKSKKKNSDRREKESKKRPKSAGGEAEEGRASPQKKRRLNEEEDNSEDISHEEEKEATVDA